MCAIRITRHSISDTLNKNNEELAFSEYYKLYTQERIEENRKEENKIESPANKTPSAQMKLQNNNSSLSSAMTTPITLIESNSDFLNKKRRIYISKWCRRNCQ